MINGMTGFGSCEFTANKVKVMVEIKSVNHRYLDAVFYLPSGFSSYEDKLQKSLAKQLKRGRVTVSVRITDKPSMAITLNKEAVRKYVEISRNLARDLKLKNDLSTADLLKLPGVVETKETFIEAADLWVAVEKAVEKALVSVVNMRRKEGKALAMDISAQLKQMSGKITHIKNRASFLLKEKKGKLTPDEFLSFQKGNDINEEISRLAHHVEEAKKLLKGSEGAGKKLDFIAQEMQRETNTIGSKVQDKEVSGAVITIKAMVEKIREQANNVE